MKRLSAIILFVFLGSTAWSQLIPMLNQYWFHPLVINPATAGNNEALSATLMYRNQWVGVEGSPSSRSIGIDAPLKKESIGLGLLYVDDRIGFTKGSSLFMNYAFRFKLGKGKMSLGLGTGFTWAGINRSQVIANDMNDEWIFNDSPNQVYPDFSFGIHYKTKTWFLGFSIPYFLDRKFDSPDFTKGVYENLADGNLLLNGGIDIGASENIVISPSFLLKYNPAADFQADFNTNVIFNNSLLFGLSYRLERSLVTIIQYYITPQLKLGYSYDFVFYDIGKHNYGTHEIAVRYEFGYTVDISTPRRL